MNVFNMLATTLGFVLYLGARSGHILLVTRTLQASLETCSSRRGRGAGRQGRAAGDAAQRAEAARARGDGHLTGPELEKGEGSP